MLGVLAAPAAVLESLDLALDRFAVLAAPIINTLAGGAGQFD